MKTALYAVSALNLTAAIATGSRLCLVFAVVTGLTALGLEAAGLVRVMRRMV